MSQTAINKVLAKNVCKHKAGDTWEAGCCGEDKLVQKYSINLEEQKNDNINPVEHTSPTQSIKI
ncbi:hypothetical protein [Nostoc cycadae]|uniref:Uncharacterized protein n=1 Tax=Nostoc cycadae WK-1 TaxID=1861711 RepID=A0A2H6LHK1_9NOSO|nr:hypothetical protein [Nostoc cycadae]GBE92688.1 hypothetical protein NCWK1_2446 [Nostoc cycadae WK-1]